MVVNVYEWRSSGVNPVLILEFDPRNHLSEQHLMELAAIWTFSLLSFLYSPSLSIPPYINPLALTGIMLEFLFNPVHSLRYEACFWALRVLGRILAASFFHVGFADFWLADQLNSQVTACLDYHFLICFYINNGDWLTVGTDSYETIFDNPYFYVWVLASVVSSIYAYTWGIQMDWGLLDKSAGENKFLREETVYSSTTFYYFAIVEDFVFRFSWIALFITEWQLATSDLVTSILAPLEVFRQFVCNFFQLENEHLNKCGKFRAVRDISVAPIGSSDQAQILRMMDEEDGVINRHKRKAGKKKEDTKLLIPEPSEPIPPSFLDLLAVYCKMYFQLFLAKI